MNCTHCGRASDALEICCNCHSAEYCSASCKIMGSVLHSRYCEALKEIREKKRAAPTDIKTLIHRVTIDFPIESRPPEFKLTKISRDDDYQLWSTAPHQRFPVFHAKMIRCSDYRIEIRGEADQGQINGSFQHVMWNCGITTNSLLMARPTPRGQVRVFVYTFVDGVKTYLDANLTALREILSYISHHLTQINIYRSPGSPFISIKPAEWVLAWIIHGKKDQSDGIEIFQPVKLKKDHPIFLRETSEVQTSWISLNLDLPIRCLKLNEEEGEAGNEWAGYAMETPFGLDTGSWGREKRQEWSSRSLKTVLVAREDEKDFTLQHREAFFGFCKEVHDNAILPPALGRDLSSDVQEYIGRHLQPRVFKLYFERMKQMKGLFDENWRASASPFRKTKIVILRFTRPKALEAFVDAEVDEVMDERMEEKMDEKMDEIISEEVNEKVNMRVDAV